MTITLAQLRAVDAVAREGQISRAAQSLGVSQPSISHQIQTFETTWNIRFFVRDGYSISVHPEAHSVLGRIRLLISLLEEIEQDLASQSSREAKTLHLGFSAHRLIMPALSEFVTRHPAVSVNTQGAPTFELLAALKRGELHLASVSLPAPPQGFHAVELARRRLILYGRPEHPLLQEQQIGIADLDGLPMVLWNQNSGSRRQFSAICAAAGVAPKTALEVNTLDVAYAAVAAGIGLGVAVEGEIAPDTHIVTAGLAAEGAEIGHYLLCLKGAELRPQVADFIHIAQSVQFLANI
ncbi:LysR family transcriptional regulator [Mycoplana ramosa]|uniref:LysR family transcriptional regulator n=1 Tax=Mycoplana ramosa TaxID=40837 RepID=A0ABW3YYY3_MYCRA